MVQGVNTLRLMAIPWQEKPVRQGALTRTSGDQWVIGFTPDVVAISQWLGFPTTDEGHYLADSSAGTASEIFRNVASVLQTVPSLTR